MAFTNPFFTLAGQKERFQNVGAVLNIAFNPLRTDKKSTIAASVGGTTGKVLTTIANHPYATAGVATVIAKPAVAVTLAKQGLAQLTTKQKIVAGAAALPTAQLLISSPKARGAVVTAGSTLPSTLASAGQVTANFIENPSLTTGKEALKNPIIATVAAAATAVGVIKAGALVSSALNFRETKKQTAAFEEANILTKKAMAAETVLPVAGYAVNPTQGQLSSPITDSSTEPLEQQTKEIEKISRKQVSKKPIKRRKIYKEATIRNTIRVQNVNYSKH